jgi:hypothetical protein
VRFFYWSHRNKNDVDGTLVFECDTESVTKADAEYHKVIGQDVTRQPHIGVT